MNVQEAKGEYERKISESSASDHQWHMAWILEWECKIDYIRTPQDERERADIGKWQSAWDGINR
jgi:hypothetical protein